MRYLFILLHVSLFAQTSVQNALDQFTKDEAMKYASISFQISEIESGKSLYSYDPKRVLITASTAKLYSTASALSILGGDYKATTRLYTDGSIDEHGTLNGNLWIRGGGDPSFGSKYFNSSFDANSVFNSWYSAISALGIKKVAGSIIADASEFGYQGVPDGWSWNDMGNYYGAGPSGLTIYDNLIEYTFKVPSTVGAMSILLNTKPEIPDLTFTNLIEAANGGGDNAYVYGAPYQNDRFAVGTLPAGSSSFTVKGSMPDPEMLFALELSRVLESKGIVVESGQTTTRLNKVITNDAHYAKLKLIYTHKGESLLNIAKETNYRSVNLFAEHMLNLIGREKGSRGSTWQGLKVAENYWSGKIYTEGMRVADGSGLSRSNAISAQNFTSLLNYMYIHHKEDWLKTLPVSGKSGTMSGVCKGQSADGRLQAKSGSINGVRSYAGYLTGNSGKVYSFALIVNNADCSSSALKSKMERLFNAMVVL